jgi:hypothetical protein
MAEMQLRGGRYAGVAVLLAAQIGTPIACTSSPADGSECLAITNEQDGCVCEKSLEDFCSVANCSIPDTLECGSRNFSAFVFYRGCGYVLRSSSGEEESAKIWSEESGELVFPARSIPILAVVGRLRDHAIRREARVRFVGRCLTSAMGAWAVWEAWAETPPELMDLQS